MSGPLQSLFGTADSFMYFAEGLRALRAYQTSGSTSDLDASERALKTGLGARPDDPLLNFYYGLICLEQVSDLSRKARSKSVGMGVAEGGSLPLFAYADPTDTLCRENLVIDSLLHFEQYQLGRGSANNREKWLYLWSEYNRAAAQVHRLNPQGYLRARGILRRYLASEDYPELERLPFTNDLNAVPRNGASQPFKFARHPFERKSYWARLRESRTADKAMRARKRPEEPYFADSDYQVELATLQLQVESLFNLTRARPLREAEAMRQQGQVGADVGFEPIKVVEEALEDFRLRLDHAQAAGFITEEAARDLYSDYWSQQGHLACASALREAGCTPETIRALWPDLDRPLNNRQAFAYLALQFPKVFRSRIIEAALCFRRAVNHQPRWLPARCNLEEMDDLRLQMDP